jgi:hypothetical protein
MEGEIDAQRRVRPVHRMVRAAGECNVFERTALSEMMMSKIRYMV